MSPGRRLLITVCPREAGRIVLPVERDGPRRRLDARAVARALRTLVTERGLTIAVRVDEGCAGGCHGRGPNVSVTTYPPQRPGERPDSIAIAWRSYAGSLGALPCLANVIDQNLGADGGARARRRRGR